MKTKIPRPSIDWAVVKERLRQSQLAWEKPLEDDPSRLAALLDKRRRQLDARLGRVRVRADGRPFLFFTLGRERYGLPLTALAEVVPFRAVTPLPRTPAGLLGVMNLRGVVLSVADLAALLDLPVDADRPAGFVLVARGGPFPLGLRVDEVMDVRRVAEADVSPPPEASSRVAGLTRDHTVLLDMVTILTHPLIHDKETGDE